VTPFSATFIDHIYSTNISTSSKSDIIINGVSDHFGTFHTVKTKIAHPGKTQHAKEKITETSNIIFDQVLE